MTKREQELRTQLDEANRRIAALDSARLRDAEVAASAAQARPQVVVVNTAPARNALQTISDWWHGGSSQEARTRHMRVNY